MKRPEKWLHQVKSPTEGGKRLNSTAGGSGDIQRQGDVER